MAGLDCDRVLQWAHPTYTENVRGCSYAPAGLVNLSLAVHETAHRDQRIHSDWLRADILQARGGGGG